MIKKIRIRCPGSPPAPIWLTLPPSVATTRKMLTLCAAAYPQHECQNDPKRRIDITA